MTQIGTYQGLTHVEVDVDLTRSQYSLRVDDTEVASIPFDQVVPIDTIRFFAHRMNSALIGGREIDNVVLGGDGTPIFGDDFEWGDLSAGDGS